MSKNEAVILTIIQEYGEMSKLRLSKLLFLIDLDYTLRYGKRLTSLTYNTYTYG
jgi:hypothetical protein